MSQLLDTPMKLSLTISTSDLQSDILVLDARGRLVQRGCGPIQTFDVEEGIYRVKVLTGTEFQEKSIVLTKQPSEPLRFGPLSFVSSAPLAGTSTSHEYHVAAADRESRNTHVADGTGSSLFFLVRDWTPSTAKAAPPRITGNPAEGLSLHSVSTTGERKICDLAVSGVSDLRGDPWAACTIGVVPGVYELRLQLPTGEVRRQSFAASAGWQTQSFLFMRQYATESLPQWRADLSRTSVLLSRQRGFAPSEPLLRVAELARVSLATKGSGEGGEASRPLLPQEMRNLFREKFSNPMLGIYGAHLLLLEKSVDLALFRDVVGNLRGLLGSHPDVEALALRAGLQPQPVPFEQPPMLSRSWSLIADATVERPDLVTEFLAQRNTGDFLSEGPWYVRRSPSPSVDVAPNDLELSDVEAALAEDLGVLKLIRRMRQTQPQQSGQTPSTAPQPLSLPEGFGEGPLAKTPDLDEAVAPYVVDDFTHQATPASIDAPIDASRLRSMVAQFGIPSTQLKGVLTNLEQKLNRNPNVPNLRVFLK